MHEGKRVLVVVPARGGSKGIRLKNLQPVKGVPLVAIVAKVIRELGFVDRAICSTDHPEIAEIARAAGIEVPFMRPEEISGDRISDLQVLCHALVECEAIDGTTYDIVVMLQPTSPLRRPHHVSEAVQMLVSRDLDAVWTVSPSDLKYHPLKQLTIDGQLLDYYDPRGEQIIARQQLDPLYHRNGVAYAITRHCLLELSSIKGLRTGAVVVEEPMVSIDTPQDIELAESLLDGGTG